jgi:hypothetical protein
LETICGGSNCGKKPPIALYFQRRRNNGAVFAGQEQGGTVAASAVKQIETACYRAASRLFAPDELKGNGPK